jgi:hypothetical protein
VTTCAELIDYLQQFDADVEVVLNGEDLSADEAENIVDLTIAFEQMSTS